MIQQVREIRLILKTVIGSIMNMVHTFSFVGYGGPLAIDGGRISSPKYCLRRAFSRQAMSLGETEITLGKNMES